MKKAFLLITVMALTAIPPLATANAGQPTSALTELTQQRGVRETLMGRISTIDNVLHAESQTDTSCGQSV